MLRQNYCLKMSTCIVLQLFWIIVYLKNTVSSRNIPKTDFVMVWHLRLPHSTVSIFKESIHIIIICNLSYGWCIDKELNPVQCFMIAISFYIIKAAFRKLVFHVTPWRSTFFETLFLNRTLLFHNKSFHSSFIQA
jgi:hypothetical protein